MLKELYGPAWAKENFGLSCISLQPRMAAGLLAVRTVLQSQSCAALVSTRRMPPPALGDSFCEQKWVSFQGMLHVCDVV